MSLREPVLTPAPIRSLRPTQMSIGYREVAQKRRQWKSMEDDEGLKFLGRHMIPVIRGPKERYYIVDHHHLCRALHEEGVEDISINMIADLRSLKTPEFWTFLDNRNWCYLYDAEGRRRDFKDIPTSVDGMGDDPYRSLAGELRRAGGFAKDDTPFSEFIWADYLRRRIKPKLVADNFPGALTRAMQLSKEEDACHLPGWCGPNPIV